MPLLNHVLSQITRRGVLKVLLATLALVVTLFIAFGATAVGVNWVSDDAIAGDDSSPTAAALATPFTDLQRLNVMYRDTAGRIPRNLAIVDFKPPSFHRKLGIGKGDPTGKKDVSSTTHHRGSMNSGIVANDLHLVPVGERHDARSAAKHPYIDPAFVDEPTRMVEAIDPQTPAADADPYDRPEDADTLAKKGSIWFTLLQKYKNIRTIGVLLDANGNDAMCLISAVYTRNCKYLDESFEECVLRHGLKPLRRVLSEKCRKGRWWLNFVETFKAKYGQDALKKGRGREAKNGSKSAYTPPQHGLVPAAELCDTDRPDVPFVPAANRTVAPMGTPRHCRNGALQYPVHFGTPAVNVQPKLFPKLFDFSPIPLDAGNGHVTGWNDEDTYQAILGLSRFCLTHARGGWDCGRHYEVMGAGCVPYFYDIHAAGPYILPQFPKKLFRDIVKMPIFRHLGYIKSGEGDVFDVPEDHPYVQRLQGALRDRLLFKVEPFTFHEDETLDQAWYWSTARKLLQYTRMYLTTEAMAAYVLETMGVAETVRHVLILSRNEWDNLHQSIVTGLDGLGIKMTIVVDKQELYYGCFQQLPKVPLASVDVCLQRSLAGRGSVHANGAPWANRMRGREGSYVFLKTQSEALRGLEDGLYDAAIYTHYWPGTVSRDDFFAVKYGVRGRVAVLDNFDSMEDPRSLSTYVAREAYFFSRELRFPEC